MRLSLMLLAALLVGILAAPPVIAQEPIPRCTTVEPMSGKIGTEIVVTGENLDKQHVAKLYLTDGQNDIEMAIKEQDATTLKSVIPKGAKPGVRYRLMILTRGKEPKLIEQPVRFEVEE
ncbi:MAG: IPT/TIG domain-containing protein [Acidobacteriota bacterium]